MLGCSIIKLLKGVIGLAAITDIAEFAFGTNSGQQVHKNFMQWMPVYKPTEYHLANPSKQPLPFSRIILQGNKTTSYQYIS